MIALFTASGLAWQAGADGPYKVLKAAKVGGEGSTDYICGVAGRRRTHAQRGQARPATDTTPPAVPAEAGDDLISTRRARWSDPGVGGNGAASARRRPWLYERPSPACDSPMSRP
jgi:hypothetical protein